MGKTTLPEGVSLNTPRPKKAPKRKHRGETPAQKKKRLAAAKRAKKTKGKRTDKGGRPTDYRPEYCEQLVDMFRVAETRILTKTFQDKKGNIITSEEEIGAKLPTLAGFACAIDVSECTLSRWAKAYPDFADAMDRAKTHASRIVQVCGMLGHYMQPFAVLYMKTHAGWRDQMIVTGPNDGPIEQVTITKAEHDRRRAAVLKKMEQLERRALA